MRIRLSSAALGALAFFASSCTDTQPTAPAHTDAATSGPSAFIAPASSVRITEIHYDNAGTDAGEAVEITGPAGMSLAGWSVVLYNGNGGAAYNTRTFTTETIDASCTDRGTYVITYPVNGIQNGNPDGIALVNAAGAVVEFLSYGGPMTAVGGPADGMTSTDIGITQTSATPVGASLQRTSLLAWSATTTHTFGACNYVEGGGPGEIATVGIEPATATVFVGATQELAATARDEDGNVVPATFTWSSSDAGVATVDAAGKVTGIVAGTATITATTGSTSGTATITVSARPAGLPDLYISELHYDDAGTDEGEAVEVNGPAGADLSGWSLVLYNGSNGASYGTLPLTGTIPAMCDGRGVVVVPGPASGIQNGDPDGIALVGPGDVVVEFISYEGIMTATNGPANGMTSVDIGVRENGVPEGQSLQRRGATWFGPVANTFGACNGDGPPPPPEKRVVIFGRDSGDPELPVGYEYQLFADYVVGNVVTPTTITWRSLDESIATVDEDGVVHAVAAGTARVEAVAADGTTSGFTVRTQAGTANPSANYLNAVEFGIPSDGDASDDFLIIRREFTSSYSRIRNTPNWVSWTLDATQFGSLDRCNCFTMDPKLPSSFTRITTADYTGAGAVAGFGIDRGHLVRSFDRTGAVLDNAATFLFSNIIPQTADNNQGPWGAFEVVLGDSARTGRYVIYNIAGVAGSRGTVKNEGIITIPEYVWKVAVLMPRGQGLAHVDSHDDLKVIAVAMPNVPGIRQTDWKSYIVTVDSVEALSGYDVLSLLRDDIEIAVESNTKPPVAAHDGPYAAIQNESIDFSGAGSRDADGDALTYAWNFGDGGTASGVSATHAYERPGTFTVRLIVTDPRGLADTVVTTARIISHAAAVQQASGMIGSLVTAGQLPDGNAQALQAKLASTQRALLADRHAARVHLDQAVKQLEIFVRQGFVTASHAAELEALLARIAAAM